MAKLYTWILIFVLAVAILPAVDSKFRGGGGRGGFRGRSSRGGGGRGRSGVSRNANRRPFSIFGSRNARPVTYSVYRQNSGGYSGYYSNSRTGFGHGLGSGLAIGYGAGLLSRPVGFGYGYSYYHYRRRQPWRYDDEGALSCAVANTTDFIQARDNGQSVDIQEGKVTCSEEHDLCRSRIRISQVNITVDGTNETSGFLVQIEKGCASRSDYLDPADNSSTEAFSDYKYNSTRRCWTSSLSETSLDSPANDTYDWLPAGVLEALKIDADDVTELMIKYQAEECVCEGHRCNVAAVPAALDFLVMISAFIAALLRAHLVK